ncbi:MAG: amidohydrolase family protein [Lachnospiraceae bacterium]|nr:amidohydrolase family protein [Lachnospiraceae bacterium]
MLYDTRFINGLVFCSETGTFQKTNVYVQNGVIAEAENDDSADARVTVDCEGKYVLPGLIDEHLHINLYGTIIGANADTVCVPSGITTAVDGGSCGASNFVQFYNSNVIRYEPHVYSYLNVSTFGNKSLCKHEEDHDPADFRPDLMEKLFRAYPDTLRGLKVRMCKATLGDYGMAPLYRAIEISEDLQSKGYFCPVVIHYDDLPDNVSVEELFNALRPGDIAAHVYQCKAETIFLKDGTIHPAVRRARERGVIMDDCHGRVHWTIPHLQKAAEQDFLPDIISSDCVRISEYVRPGFSLIYAMCMQSACGMPLEKVLQAVTINPAKALGICDRAGSLRVGMPADIAVFDIQDTERIFADNYGNTIKGSKLFVPLLTMIDGRIAYRQIFF